MKRKFWNWIKNEDESVPESRTLFLNGEISDETWFGDEVTPGIFRDELSDGQGDIAVWINSPGGDVFAAAQIYNMLRDYNGKVTVKIDSLAASAASVIAMAGDEILMGPTALMMIHNPMTVVAGSFGEMQKAMDMLDEVKQAIINAYEDKTGMRRGKISSLMDAESWFNAKKAVELGFADGILFQNADSSTEEEKKEELEAMLFQRAEVTNSFFNKFSGSVKDKKPVTDTVKKDAPAGIPVEQLQKRLQLLKP
jgi:ATP-dependent Clp protease protease subunit|nr:MAG TPA_asm: Putative ATP dependent Clp protease [Caudoviricetes sp.]